MKCAASLIVMLLAGLPLAGHAAPVIAGPQATAANIRTSRGNAAQQLLRLNFQQAGDEANGTELTLDLASDYIRVRTGKSDDIFDYKLRRHFELDDSRRSFTNVSLYAEIAFRALEAANRLYLGKVLAQAGVQNAAIPTTPAAIESQLGIASPNFPVVTLQQNNDPSGAVSFVDGTTPFGSVRFGNARFSEIERRNFDRFLHDAIVVSPQIADAVGSDGRIPNALVYASWKANDRSNVTLRLNGIAHVTEPFPLPADYSSGFDSPTPQSGTLRALFPLMRDAVAGKALSGPRTVDSYLEAILRAAKNGASLQVTVLSLELTLQHGRSAVCSPNTASDRCNSLLEALRSSSGDPQAQKLGRALSVSQVPDAAERITLLKQIDRSQLTDPYLLDLFIANDLGRDEAAAELFANAIRGNPYLSGAYKDFGDYFYRQFDTWSAWTLYDMARNLPGAGETPMAGAVDPVEQKLASDFPRFF